MDSAHPPAERSVDKTPSMPRPGSKHREQPTHGLCGVCGCRVVDHWRFSPWAIHGQGYEMWRNGHCYDRNGHLQKVRCLRHDGRGFHPGLAVPLAN